MSEQSKHNVNRIVPAGNEPVWPPRGAAERGLVEEITDSGQWVAFGSRSGGVMWPALNDDTSGTWRPALEQMVAETMGYRYGIGVCNGTVAMEVGLRAQFKARGRAWARGRSEVLVPDFTCVPALEPFLTAVALELQRSAVLVPFDALADGTMDPAPVRAYLAEHGDRVLAVSPVTQYGNYGRIADFVELGNRYEVAHHHDDARGGAARREGPRAPTASISGHSHAKPTPAPEAGMCVANDDEIAYYIRTLTDCGTPPFEVDHIPTLELPRFAAGNKRLGEHSAGLLMLQWLRAMADAGHARENRRAIQGVITDPGRFGTAPILSGAPVDPDAFRAPIYKLLLVCTGHLEEVLGVTPEGFRQYLLACGIPAEQPDVPAHLLPAWSGWTEGRQYPVADRLYTDGILVHTAFLRDPRFAGWFTDAIDQALENKDAIRERFGHL